MEWGGLLGGIASGIFGYQGAKAQNIASAQQAEKAMAFSKEAQLRQMKFQERMSGSAHQRQMADMRKAGLNPILSAKYGGASSPAGSSAAGVAAPQYNKAERAMNSAMNAANIVNINANTELALAKAGALQPIKKFGEQVGPIVERTAEKTKSFAASMWDDFIQYGKENPASPGWQMLMDKGIINIMKSPKLRDQFINFLFKNNLAGSNAND